MITCLWSQASSLLLILSNNGRGRQRNSRLGVLSLLPKKQMAKKSKSIYHVMTQAEPETELTINDFKDRDIKDVIAARKRDYLKQLKHFPSIAEKLAKSSVYYRNWYYPEGKQKFPYDVEMRCVAKMFPYASVAPLLVDEPKTEDEFNVCMKKAVILREHGYRYIIVSKDAEFYELVLELEELDKRCPGTQQ